MPTITYSSMTQEQAEDRLGFTFRSLNENAILVDNMLANVKNRLEGEVLEATKEMVYDYILQYLLVEGYPTHADEDFKEAGIKDLVLYIIGPILGDFIRLTGHKSVKLLREKEIVSSDGVTRGTEEFVMVDLIGVGVKKYIFIVVPKSTSLGLAMKECLLAMKDMRDNNGGGEVYGFITIGEYWRMLRYDGKEFCITRDIHVLFQGMDQEKEKANWMKDYSVIVDCMYVALSKGGIVKDVVVRV
jgi:hypothetical protein